MVGLSHPHPRWSRPPSPSPPTSPTQSTRFPSPTNPTPHRPHPPPRRKKLAHVAGDRCRTAAADLPKMYKDLGAKAWESTVRRTQAAARKHAAIFSAMSVAHADDDGGPARPRHAEKPLPNGELYTGDWAREVPHGVGKYLWADGCMYEGEWARGKATGKGKFSWPSGATYEGQFKGGYMDGFGTYTSAGGESYRGHWVMNLKHGAGMKSYCNGDYYDGDWRCGVQDGRGRYVWRNGNEYDGEWRDGAIVGKGALVWSTGSRYIGNWNEGAPAGDGRFLWPDGSFYVGVWSRDPKEQSGSYYPAGAALPANNHNWDPQQVYEVDLKECKVCSGEKVSILPSQKRFNWEKGWRRKTPPRKRTLGAPEVWDGERSEEVADCSGERDDDPCTARPFNPSTLPKVRKQGETVSKGHKNYELMLNLQLGIRHSVGRPGPTVSPDLKASAFDPKDKLWTKFPPEGSKHTPPHHSCDFRWKDYSPLVFRTLRKLFKIDPADYMLSICGNNALRELSSPGKSGSFFYLTHDDKYMIKTMKKSEVKVLLRMLPAYYDHVRAFENTLVTKFFGLHCVKLTGATQRKVRFVIMGNLFCSEYPIQRRFDLKGSSLGRITDKPAAEINENTTLKDLDLNFIFRLHKCWIQEMHWQVDRDCEFLEQERVMDYSLLVGLHFRDSCTTELVDAGSPGDKTFMGSPESDIDTSPCLARADTGLLLNNLNDRWPNSRLGINMPARAEQTVRKYDSSGEPQLIGEPTGYFYDVVLCFGIIDILQDYDISKKLEHAYKSIQHDPTSMSAVDPKQYSRRFRDFNLRAFVEDTSSSSLNKEKFK